MQEKEIYDFMVRVRRDIHQHPEIGFQEFRTSQLVRTELEAAGYEVRSCAGTGLTALLEGHQPGPTILLRADMDALRMKQESGLEFASKNGLHHACGHDGHVAMLLATAIQAKKSKAKRKGNVKFVFQPAEEGLGGAAKMISDEKNPVLEGVDKVFALHLDNSSKAGLVKSGIGLMNANSDRFQIIVTGKACHTMSPDEGIDANLIGCTIVTALYNSRIKISPLEPCTLGINMIRGGSAYNIVSNEFQLIGALRTLGDKSRQLMQYVIEKTASGIAESMGGKVVTTWRPPIYTSVLNTAPEYERVKECCRKLGVPFVEGTFGLAGQDFSCFTREKPGCFFLLGSAPEGSLVDDKPTIPHHCNVFTFSEEVMLTGFRVWTQLIEEELAIK